MFITGTPSKSRDSFPSFSYDLWSAHLTNGRQRARSSMGVFALSIQSDIMSRKEAKARKEREMKGKRFVNRDGEQLLLELII